MIKTQNFLQGKSMAIWVVFLTLFSFTFLSIQQSYASVVNAASCGASDVQAAMNNAKDGDSVSIPAGNCTWSTKVTINGSSRSLSVYGAGQGSTKITLNVSGDGDLVVTLGTGKLFQLSQMTFTHMGDPNASYPIQFAGKAGANSFRVHHVTFDSSNASGNFDWIRFTGTSYGVFDHISAIGRVEMFVNADAGNCSVWGQADGPGTPNAIFIEDSTFNWTGHNEGNPIFDSENGGRIVFRNNNGTNITFGNHGSDSGECGGLLSEVYNNKISLTDYNPGNCTWNISGGGFRAGQVIMYNNSWNVAPGCQFGSWGSGSDIKLSIYRDGGFMPAWKYACSIGNVLKFCSQLNPDWSGSMTDCKTDADCGTGTCKWKMSSGSMSLCTSDADAPSAETCNRYVDGGTTATSGHPCFNAPGMGVGNRPSPCYQWNNTMTGSADGTGPITFSGGSKFLTLGVDYYNGTQKPGYASYVYPHPLNTSAPLTAPLPSKTPYAPGSIIVK